MQLIIKAALIFCTGLFIHSNAMDKQSTHDHCYSANMALAEAIHSGTKNIFCILLDQAIQKDLQLLNYQGFDANNNEFNKGPFLLHGLLQEASRHNEIDCIKKLLQVGASINSFDYYTLAPEEKEKSPLYAAVESRLIFIIRPAYAHLPTDAKQKLNRLNLAPDGHHDQFIGTKDTTPAIEYLLERNADTQVTTNKDRSVLGLVMKAKACLPHNAPENTQIYQLIELLQKHGATLSLKEEAASTTDPMIRSIRQKLSSYRFFDPHAPKPEYGKRCNKIKYWTCLSSLCGSAIALPTLWLKYHAKIPSGKAAAILYPAIAAASYISSRWIIPNLAKATYAGFSYIRRTQLEKSLFGQINQIIASKKEHTEQFIDILGHIVSQDKYGAIAMQCKERLEKKFEF